MKVSDSIFVPCYSYTAKATFYEEISELAHLAFFSYALLGNYVGSKLNWKTTLLRKIALLHTLRKILLVALGVIIYESTHFSKKELDAMAINATTNLQKKGYTLKRMNLYRSGTRYSATSILAPGADPNRWCVSPRGINDTMESSLEQVAERNKEDGFNTLMINGPFVGRSSGLPTPFQLAAGVEAGMQFLEERGAKYIVVDGHSFGASMALEAAMLHDFSYSFSRNIKYLFISDRTFDTFLNVAKATVFRFVHKIVGRVDEKFSLMFSECVAFVAMYILKASGYDLDCVKGSKKLNALGIRHLIIQVEGNSDHRIPAKTSLMEGLKTEKSLPTVRLLTSDTMTHSGNYPVNIKTERAKEIFNFTRSA